MVQAVATAGHRADQGGTCSKDEDQLVTAGVDEDGASVGVDEPPGTDHVDDHQHRDHRSEQADDEEDAADQLHGRRENRGRGSRRNVHRLEEGRGAVNGVGEELLPTVGQEGHTHGNSGNEDDDVRGGTGESVDPGGGSHGVLSESK